MIDDFETTQQEYEPTQQQLEPGGSSLAGFLAKGESLKSVIDRDNQALVILGYTHQQVADLLIHLIHAVNENRSNYQGFQYTAPNKKNYKVQFGTYRGFQPCPWDNGFFSDKSRCKINWQDSPSNMDITVSNEEGKEVLSVAGLLPHLITEHHFFEGSVMHRTAPEDIIETLGTEKIPDSIEKVRTTLIQIHSYS